jgi:hypothetical protein
MAGPHPRRRTKPEELAARLTRGPWPWHAGGLVCLAVLLGGTAAARADQPRERFGLELRIGGQAPRNFPELGLYASVGFARSWSAVLGYEVLRTYGVWLPKSCPTTVSPAIMAGLRSGVAYRRRLRYGFGLRGAALLGLSAPELAAGPFPKHVNGAVFDVALDLAATWTWRVLEVALFIDGSYNAGALSSHVCATSPRVSAQVSEVGLLYGLGAAVRW